MKLCLYYSLVRAVMDACLVVGLWKSILMTMNTNFSSFQTNKKNKNYFYLFAKSVILYRKHKTCYFQNSNINSRFLLHRCDLWLWHRLTQFQFESKQIYYRFCFSRLLPIRTHPKHIQFKFHFYYWVIIVCTNDAKDKI